MIEELMGSAFGGEIDNALYLTYFYPDGRIKQVSFAPPIDSAFHIIDGCERIVGRANLHTDFVDTRHNPPQITKRPVFAGFDKTEIKADGIDKAVMTGLPIPCRVYVDGVPFDIDSGSMSLSSKYRATYTVEIDQFPFMPFQGKVTCTSI